MKHVEISYVAQGHSSVIETFYVPDSKMVDAVQDALYDACKSLRAVRDAAAATGGASDQPVALKMVVEGGKHSTTTHSFFVSGSKGVDAIQDAMGDSLKGLRAIRDAAHATAAKK